jgi:uncharacterized protein HemY
MWVEGLGLAAAVVVLGIWANVQQIGATVAAGLAQPPQMAQSGSSRALSADTAASVAAWMTRAEAALKAGDEEAALRGVRAALVLDPHHEEAGLREVELLLSRGQDEAALRALMPRMTRMLPGSEAHTRALCLEAGGRMMLEPERAQELAAQACAAGAEACCDPFATEL